MTPLIVSAQGSTPNWAAFRFLAQTPAPAAPPPLPAEAQPAPWGNLIMPLFIVGAILLIFAPQMKRNKEHQKLLTGLKTGDEVITTGGMMGVITQVKPDRFVVEISKGVRVEINRTNVEARVPSPDKDQPAEDKKA